MKNANDSSIGNTVDELRSISAYEYDSRGNMLTKKQYDYTTGDLNGITPSETTTFTYANSGWKDQLVAVNGTALTYDESGNLRTYGFAVFGIEIPLLVFAIILIESMPLFLLKTIIMDEQRRSIMSIFKSFSTQFI